MTAHRPKEFTAREKSCTNKRRYFNESAAKKRIKWLGAEPYHCRYCDGWHLTTKHIQVLLTEGRLKPHG